MQSTQKGKASGTDTSAKTEIKNGDIHIDYTDTGKGDTTLLFVHGWAINKTYWDGQVAQFKDRYRVVTLDLPGFGLSGKTRTNWNTHAFAGDIKAVVNQLKLNNVVLIGHSMAGDIALQAAVDMPDKVIGLIGIDNFKGAGGPPMTAAQKKDFEGAIASMKKNFSKSVRVWFDQELFSKTTNQAVKERILKDVMHNDTVIAVKALEQEEPTETANLLKLKRKLYLINSDYQPTDTTGLVKNRIPYQIIPVHGTGHYPMIEAPADFNAALGKVLSRMAID